MTSQKEIERVAVDRSKTYYLQLNPNQHSLYQYELRNQSELKLTMQNQDVNISNTTSVGFKLSIGRDSPTILSFAIKYDTIHLNNRNDEIETDFDAANGAFSGNPLDKMLCILKKADIVAHITPTGEVKSVSGYNELTEKIMASFAGSDTYTKAAAEVQWRQFIEKGVIQKGMEQIFQIFPDSAVHVGDKWKLSKRQSDELGVTAHSNFTLKSIEDGIATISANGVIASDTTTTQLMGQTVSAKLSGEQTAEYELEAQTGMLLKSNSKAKIEGTVQMLGREIPVNIEIVVEVKGKRVK
jgi:hypothetical protein